MLCQLGLCLRLPIASDRAERALEAARGIIEANPLKLQAGITCAHPQVIVLRVMSPLVEPTMDLLKQVWATWRHALWQLAQRTAPNLERLNRDQLPNALGLHFVALTFGNHFTAFHHHVGIGQFFGKVVVLLAQQHGHALALHAFIGQLSNHAANVLDDAGLNAFCGLIQNEQLGLGRQSPRNGQLLLLTAREVTTPTMTAFASAREKARTTQRESACRQVAWPSPSANFLPP
jgi:hypothetical protein